jgi:hypothetical protein
MIAAFYIGVFGSICLSNIVRVFINSVLAERVYKNKTSWLRFIVASESLRVVEEISYVR